jgi:hypothetical protein
MLKASYGPEHRRTILKYLDTLEGMLVDKEKGKPILLGNEIFKDTRDDAEFCVEYNLNEITAGVQGAIVGGAVTTVRSHS